jgi:hypothetical protein
MNILWLLAIGGALLTGSIQGMDSEITQKSDKRKLMKSSENTSKISSEHYRQILREGKREREEFYQELKTILQAKESLHVSIKSQIEEICNRHNYPPIFLKKLAAIQRLICPPERLFIRQPDQLLYLTQSQFLIGELINCHNIINSDIYQKLEIEILDTCNRLDNFNKRWKQLSYAAGFIHIAAIQSLGFEQDWLALIDPIVRRSTTIKGERFYECIGDCFKIQHELSKNLSDLKKYKLLTSEQENLIAELISYFQQRGEVLWEIVKTQVPDISVNFNELDQEYLFTCPAKNFFCPITKESDNASIIKEEIKIKPIPEELRKRLEKTFLQPKSWQKKIDTLKKYLRSLMRIQFVIKPLEMLSQHYKNFQVECDPNIVPQKFTIVQMLSPWINGDIDGHLIRLPQPIAQTILGFQTGDRSNVYNASAHSTDELTFTECDYNFVVEMNVIYWLRKLFNFTLKPVCFGAFEYTPPQSNSFEATKEPVRKYVMIQKKSSNIPFAEFLSRVASGRGSFEQLDSQSVGINFIYSLLLGSAGFRTHFSLLPNGNQFDIEISWGDFLPGDSYHNRKTRHKCDPMGISNSVIDDCFYFFPWVNQQIPDQVKETIQSHNIMYILLSLVKTFGVFGEYFKHHLTVDGGQETLTNDYDYIADAIPHLIGNFQEISKLLTSKTVTYLDLIRVLQPVAFNTYTNAYMNAAKELEIEGSKFFFEAYLDIAIKEMSKILGGALELGLDIGFVQEDLVNFSNERVNVLEQMQLQSSKQPCLQWVKGILLDRNREFFSKQYERATSKGFFEARLLLRVKEMLRATREQEQSNPRNGSDSPLQNRLLTDTRNALIQDADLTSLSENEAIEILSTLLDLNRSKNSELYKNKYHKSWQHWIDHSMRYFMALPHYVQLFVTQRYAYDHSPRFEHKETQLTLLRSAQMNQFYSYKTVIDSVQRSDTPVEEQAIKLFETLLLGDMKLTSDDDRMFAKAICDLLNLQHLVFASSKASRNGPVELRVRVCDHYVLHVPRSLVEVFGSPYCLSYDLQKAFLSHNLPLFYLSWLLCLKKLDPSICFHPWFRKLPQNSKDFQSSLWENNNQPFDPLLQFLSPEYYCKLEQLFQSQRRRLDELKQEKNEVKVEKLKRELEKGEDVYLRKLVLEELDKQEEEKLTPLENQGSDFDRVPSGHQQNFEAKLEALDDQRDHYDRTPPLSIGDAATEVLDFFKDGPYITDDKLSDLDYQILELASNFTIHVPNISHNKWKDLAILDALLWENKARDQVIQLAIALQLGCDVDQVQFSEGCLRISGLRKGNTYRHKGITSIVKSISNSSRSVHTIDLSGNNFYLIDSALIDELWNVQGLKKLILSNNPLCDPTPLKVLGMTKSIQEVILEGTFIPQVTPFTLGFLKSKPNGKITWRGVSTPEQNNFGLSEIEKISIFQDLLKQLRSSLSDTKSPTIENCNIVASIIEVIGQIFWNEFLAVNHQLDLNTLFQYLHACNESRTNPQIGLNLVVNSEMAGKDANVKLVRDNSGGNTSTFSSTQMVIHDYQPSSDPDGKRELRRSADELIKFIPSPRIITSEKGKTEVDEESVVKFLPTAPVQEVAFKLLFALQYNCCFPGVSAEDLVFAKGSDKKQVIVDDPYCLTSLTLRGDLSRASLAFLSQFSGTYEIKNLGKDPEVSVRSPKKPRTINLYTTSGSQTPNSGSQTPKSGSQTPKLYCSTNNKEGIELSQKIPSKPDSVALTSYLIKTKHLFPGLQKLNLSNTNISTLYDLPVMGSLLALDISHNNFRDLDSFYFEVSDHEQEYKFPKLTFLDLSHNSLNITEEDYNEHFRRHFNHLSFLDMSENQLTFAPTMAQQLFQPKRKGDIFLGIHGNNIPLKDLYKLFNFSFYERDPCFHNSPLVLVTQCFLLKQIYLLYFSHETFELPYVKETFSKCAWFLYKSNERKPQLPRNTICLFRHPSWTEFNLWCHVFGHADVLSGRFRLPENAEQQNAYGLTQIMKRIIEGPILLTFTEYEKERLIEFIITNDPTALNTQFMHVWPQRETNTTLATMRRSRT